MISECGYLPKKQMVKGRKKSMNEELEKCKAELKKAETAESIFDHPAVQFIESMLGMIPVVDAGVNCVDAAVKKRLIDFRTSKQEELFEIIFADNSITIEDVSDVTVLMEFAKVLDAVNRLSRNGKVKYFAGLLKSSIPEIRTGNVDEFEEWMDHLGWLSVREIRLLKLLYCCEEKCRVKSMNNGEKFNVSDSWNTFVVKAKEQYGFNETETATAMMAITRSGFCMSEWNATLNNSGTLVIYTTPSYRKFLKRILMEQDGSHDICLDE